MRYPEIAAGGFTRVDGNIEFYGRVQALLAELPDGAVVMDFGAGRGQTSGDAVAYRRALQDLRAPDRTVIGVDVDPVVASNPRIDEARVIGPDGAIPVHDASVDLVVSDFTFEHVDDALHVAGELDRALKPGGWICVRTPNRWGYIAIGARLVPNRHHVAALRRLQPGKKQVDTFPTRYRMNTRRDLMRLFPAPRFAVHAYTTDSEPYLYAGASKLIAGGIRALQFAPPPLRSMWVAFIHKAPATQ